MHNEPFIYFREAQIVVISVYTTLHLPLLKLAFKLFKIEVYNAGTMTRGGTPSPQFFLQKSSFCSFFLFFFQWCTIISDLDFDFDRVLKRQQLLSFHPRIQVLPCAESCPGFKGALFFYNHLSFFSNTKYGNAFQLPTRMTLKWYKNIRIRSFKTFKS